MAILREREVRRRAVTARSRQRMDRLPTEQAANVRQAARVLRTRFGDTEALAKALGITPKTTQRLCLPAGEAPSAGAALRVAAAAGVPVEDVLSGAWPAPGACPLCGRGN